MYAYIDEPWLISEYYRISTACQNNDVSLQQK
jgi:hypothetical protein